MLGILIAPYALIAIDTTTSARIIENFKEDQKEILFETLPVSESWANLVLEHEYTMNGLEALKSRLSLMQNVYQIKKDIVTEKRMDLETALMIIDRAISETDQKIQDTLSQIHEKELKSQELARASIELQKKIYLHRTTILQYLANIYSEWSLFLDNEWKVDTIKSMVVTDGDVDSLLQDATYKSLVTVLWQKFVDEYRLMVRNYYILSVRMNGEKESLELLQNTLIQQKQNIESQKQAREELLRITKWKEEEYRTYIEASEKAKAQLEDAWQKAEVNYQQSLEQLLDTYGCNTTKKQKNPRECEKIKKYFEEESILRKTNFQTWSQNPLVWPVVTSKISAYFRDTSYYNILGAHHDAIDIPVSQWTSIVSVAPGFVQYVLPPSPGGYSYIAVRHRDGFVSVYWHLSETLVQEWDFVEAWQLIAKSGGAPWTPWAGPMTSGAHLHFEVWKNREPVDPLWYISLADLIYSELPSRYQDKFIQDIIEKTWSWSNISQYQRKFVIKWEDEKSRQEYLLSTYAAPDFKNWNMWIDTALENKIDPSFLMCVGLAETTLGNRLKTSYNIWNIWNTDDGWVYEFTSPQEWLSWMTKTLNNRFLSRYTKVSELSRWGNETGPIYASSGGNWHNNVIRCLSSLKWKVVQDEYNFRIE